MSIRINNHAAAHMSSSSLHNLVQLQAKCPPPVRVLIEYQSGCYLLTINDEYYYSRENCQQVVDTLEPLIEVIR